jgi:hypoxia up-regulated 1
MMDRLKGWARCGMFPAEGQNRCARHFQCSSVLLLLACATIAIAHAVDDSEEALVGIDYGSEWIKIAVLQGTAVDIVLNENSQRKSLAVIAFPDVAASTGNELRLFGEAAMARPHLALQYVRELLGGCLTPQCSRVRISLHRVPRSHFWLFLRAGQPHNAKNVYGPHYFPDTIEVDPVRGACRFVRSKSEAYSAEELNAMLLVYVKHLVQEHTGKPMRRCVISVPAFFADGDRRALLTAAKIAGVKVLSLVNDGLAVALKYATDNLQLAKLQGVKRVLFFDMGATATQATVVEFRGRESTSPGLPPSPPSVRVLGAAWDSSLGGAAWSNRVVELLAKGCLPHADPTADARAMARLRKEAGRAKHVLSANKETVVTVEDLIGEYDLKQVVS